MEEPMYVARVFVNDFTANRSRWLSAGDTVVVKDRNTSATIEKISSDRAHHHLFYCREASSQTETPQYVVLRPEQIAWDETGHGAFVSQPHPWYN